MTLMEAMNERHSVRQYVEKSLDVSAIAELQSEIDFCNAESGLHIQLVTNEPKAFDGFMARYGKFSGVANYIAMVGRKGANLDELCGYYGERLVLKAQQLGLNSCWVAINYNKARSAFTVMPGEKLCIVISLGYGVTQGTPHKSKAIHEVAKMDDEMPEWFLVWGKKMQSQECMYASTFGFFFRHFLKLYAKSRLLTHYPLSDNE